MVHRSMLLAGLVVLATLAFRALADYDPDAGIRRSVEGVEGWFFSPSGNSPALIFGATAWMLYVRRHRFLAAIDEGRPQPLLSSALLLPSALLCGWSYYVGGPDLLVPSLMLALQGGAVMLGGRKAFFVILQPTIFLALAIPLPAVLINQIVFPLQLFTASTSTLILDLIGVDVVRIADQFVTDRAAFQVIETCSGLRTLGTLLMATLVYAEVFSCRRWRLALLVLAVPLISFVANQIRIISIVLNPFSEISESHMIQGIIVMVGGVLSIALLDGFLGRLPKIRMSERDHRLTPGVFDISAVPFRPLIGLVGFSALLVMVSLAVQPWQPGPRMAQTLSNFPLVLRGWTSQPIDVDTQYLGSVNFTERQNRRYMSPDRKEILEVFIGIDEHLQRNFSLLSDKTKTLVSRGRALSSSVVHLDPEGLEADLFFVELRQRTREQWLVLHWYQETDSIGGEVLRSFLALDRSRFRRGVRSTVIRISTPIGETSDPDEAYARIRAFIPGIREAIQALEHDSWNPTLRKRLAAPSHAINMDS